MGLGWPGMEDDVIRLAGCVPQPPDSVPPHVVSHVDLAGAGQQLSGVWAAVRLGRGGGPSSASGSHCGRSPVVPPAPGGGPMTPLHRGSTRFVK